MVDNTENAANEPMPSADQPDKKTDDFSEELPQDPGSEAPLNPAAAPKEWQRVMGTQIVSPSWMPRHSAIAAPLAARDDHGVPFAEL